MKRNNKNLANNQVNFGSIGEINEDGLKAHKIKKVIRSRSGEQKKERNMNAFLVTEKNSTITGKMIDSSLSNFLKMQRKFLISELCCNRLRNEVIKSKTK